MEFWGYGQVCLGDSLGLLDHILFGGVMALRKQDVVRLPIRRDEASVLPRPLLELYNRASLFLDKDSTHQDHYWAVGIHKAIHKAFPECGETQTAQANPGTTSNGRPAKSPRKQPKKESDYSYRTRTHHQQCQEPSRCSAATIVRNDYGVNVRNEQNELAQNPKSIVAGAITISPYAHAADNSLRMAMKRCVGKGNRGIKADPEQLALAFASQDQDQSSSQKAGDQRAEALFLHRSESPVSMEVGQAVVLICSIWSPRNRMTIESGTWGKIAEVGSTVTVEWQLPYYQTPFWDCFPPDECLNYFEEE